MPVSIVIAGKGGTGKTTISAFLINELVKRRCGAVLAVDADPNSTLDEALGVKKGKSIVEIIDDIAAGGPDMPAGMTKERLIEYKLEESLSESSGFDLIAMGRAEGPGCYCYPNSLLREMVDRLGKKYGYLVIDNEAGMEHLSRRTTRVADIFVIVSDFSVMGLRSAGRVWELARELKISCGKVFLVINKAGWFTNPIRKEISGIPCDRIFYVPQDRKLARLSLRGIPVTRLARGSRIGYTVSSLADEVMGSVAARHSKK